MDHFIAIDMGSQLKAPPQFNPEVEDYERWKNDLEIWETFTDLSKSKQGPAVYLSLTGKAREAVRDIKAAQLNIEDGLQVIIQKLDAVFLKDSASRSFLTFQNFYQYRRGSGDDFETFIVKFEQLYHQVTEFKMVLPEGVQAFFLLVASNLSSEMEKLVRVTVTELTYENMRGQIKKIFGSNCGGDDSTLSLPVKDECLFGYSRGGYGYRGGRGRFNRWKQNGKKGSDANRSGTNPVGADGEIMKCHLCESANHLMWKCPHRGAFSEKMTEGEKKPVQDVHITLMNAQSNVKQRGLVFESLGKGVLDCGCTKTVSGIDWMDEYVGTLTNSDRDDVKEAASDVTFRFGDGMECSSIKKVTIPVTVGSLKCLMDVEVVQADIPLLISKGAMKQMGMNLNFVKDVAVINAEEIKLFCTTSGHYCIPVSVMENAQSGSNNIVLHLECLAEMDEKKKLAKALKLHKQFSHASAEKLLKLVKKSNYNDKEFEKCIQHICDNCDLCQKYKPAPLKPVVGLPMSQKFNETVCMDLKEFIHNKLWILHIIDSSTRYSAARMISTKAKEVVVQNIFMMWICYFGRPKRIMSDNGGEFSNDTLREMGEKLGIEIITSPAESPFSNGIVERHNKTLYEVTMKTLEDTACGHEIALAWGVSSKNSLYNIDGFSPNQLVLGNNISLPSLLSDELPALETTTSSEIVRKNLEALHSARENFIRAENSHKIRRALKAKTRTFADVNFQNGDKVYYKRMNVIGWKGPGIVIGEDGHTVLVKHSGAVYKCHRCHLLKVKDYKSSGNANKENVISDNDDDDYNSNVPGVEGQSIHTGLVREPDALGNDLSSDDDAMHAENSKLSSDTDDDSDSEHRVYNDDSVGISTVSESVDSSADDVSATDQISNDNDMFDGSHLPKAKSYVSFQTSDGKWRDAKVLSQQPKRRGTNGHWVNVHVNGESDPGSFNWNKVKLWDYKGEPESVVLYSTVDELCPEVIEAKQRELDNLKHHDVYETVQFNGQTTVSSRWVFTERLNDGEKQVKARIVARGFEESSNNVRTDSPTCSKLSLRLVFCSAVSFGWKIKSIDIASAFLQGNVMERDVYLEPPQDVCSSNMVWKLKRCLYGLNDAPRAWYDRFTEELISLGAVRSIYDNAMFTWFIDGEFQGHLVCHVDDLVYGGTERWERAVIDVLKQKFKIRVECQGSFKYIGLNVLQTDEGISVDQCMYIETLKPIDLSRERLYNKEAELSKKERSLLRSLGGQMLWVTTQTRPDMSFEACSMSTVGKKPTVKKIVEANKAVRQMQLTGKEVKLIFPLLGPVDKFEIKVYCDASHASLPCGSSQGSFIVFVEGLLKVAPLLWQSKKLKRITKSPLASETLAMGEAADAGLLLAHMISESYHLKSYPHVQVYTDSKSLCDALHTSNTVEDMSLRLNIARLREMVSVKEISVNWVPGKLQLADVMTKRGASPDVLLDVLRNSSLPK